MFHGTRILSSAFEYFPFAFKVKVTYQYPVKSYFSWFISFLFDCLFQEVSDNVEIIFVSSDRSIDEMKSYLKESHGSWLSVEHGSELAQALKQHFGVR